MIIFFLNFGQFLKFWPISKILTIFRILPIFRIFAHFQNFCPLSEFLPIFRMFTNFGPFWKFWQIFKSFDPFSKKISFGLSSYTFKKRYDGHTYTFRHRVQNSTTLSTHVWDLYDERKKHDIKWELIDRAPEFNPTNRKCRLCDKEKYYIIFQPEGATLNSRSELFSTCRHRKRLLLSRIKPWFSF